MRLRWSPGAVADLESISRYIEQQRGLATANEVCEIIYQAIQALRTHPRMGRSGRVEGTRELVVPSTPYLVIYRLDSERETVQITNILHGAQRYP